MLTRRIVFARIAASFGVVLAASAVTDSAEAATRATLRKKHAVHAVKSHVRSPAPRPLARS